MVKGAVISNPSSRRTVASQNPLAIEHICKLSNCSIYAPVSSGTPLWNLSVGGATTTTTATTSTTSTTATTTTTTSTTRKGY